MNVKEFLKPNLLKISIFLFIGIFFLYFAKERVSAAGFGFAFFYESYGFPLTYLIIGNTDSASGHIRTLFLGNYFSKYGNFLFNPLALTIDIILIYLLACFLELLFKYTKKPMLTQN